jgi:hypothetical protein
MGKTMHTFITYMLLTALLTGCAEFSYKQGASVGELEQVKKSCHSTDEKTTESCLRANGWFIHKFDDPNAENTKALNKVPPENPEQPKSAEAKPPSPETAEVKSQSEQIELQNSNAQRYKISSWWKIGAGESQLKLDLNQCKSNLNTPEDAKFAEQRYSKTFIRCMNAAGWKALGSTK